MFCRCGVCGKWKDRSEMYDDDQCTSCWAWAAAKEAIKTIPADIRLAVRQAFRNG